MPAADLGQHSREVLARVVEAFGDKVFHTVIARTVRFPEKTVAGEPITTYASSSTGVPVFAVDVSMDPPSTDPASVANWTPTYLLDGLGAAQGDGVRAQGVAAHGQAVGARDQHRHLRAVEPGEQGRGHADRAGAHHQRALAGLDAGPTRGVRADGQEFDHGGLVEAHALGLVDEALGHADLLGHGAVGVHAQHLDAGAAVGLALAAGHAAAAGQVGHDEHRVAGP